MIISRYVFREVLTSALLGTLLATFILFLGLGRLFELLIRATNAGAVLKLFALAVPPLLPLTVPFGVLVGILIGLGRMSADAEITAMRAAGVPGRRVTVPVLLFTLMATLLTAWASLSAGPAALRESARIAARFAQDAITADIQPRVFEEQFSNSNTILYVDDVKPGPTVTWRRVFIANLTPPEQRTTGLKEKGQGPFITVAREAIAVPDVAHNRIQLSLRDARTHEVSAEGVAYDTRYEKGEQTLAATPPAERPQRAFRDMDTRELVKYTREGAENFIEARIELHSRFALPIGCLTLALVGIPLGIATRRGGKSAGYVTAVVLAFFCYWLSFISLVGLAKQRTLPAGVAVWLPNVAFTVAGLLLILRMEKGGDTDWIAALRDRLAPLTERFRIRRDFGPKASGFVRLPLVPQLVDTYVLSQFLFHFLLMLVSFVFIWEIYTFFELMGDIVRHKIPMARVLTYLFFLIPKLIYDTVPISVLVAVLVTFGVLAKNNEVTAFRALGVSLHRLVSPVLVVSVLLSAALFAFDYQYVPEANRKQDAIRDEIKGRPVQTYLRPDRKWIMGDQNRIYNYRHFDTDQNVMVGVYVYELDPATFALRRQISAERAQWQPGLNTWIFQNGWRRDILSMSPYKSEFFPFQATTFPELKESPGYFLKDVRQEKQMNFWELDNHIRDLQRSGFDTVRLRVQLHKKFSVPLFALIMALIAAPFSFLIGTRGAMAGIGVSLGIAIAYWSVGRLFEEIGNVSHLPPSVAAWAPDALFLLGGTYLMLKMRS